MRNFSARVSSDTSLPKMVISPDVLPLRPIIMRIVELLPAPFGPSKPTHVPLFTAKETSFTASKSPYFFWIFLASTIRVINFSCFNLSLNLD